MEESPESFAQAALQQVRDELYDLTIRFVAAGGGVLLVLGTDSYRPRTWLPALVLLASVGVACWVGRRFPSLGPIALGYGLLLAILTAEGVYPDTWLGGSLALALVLIGAVGGSRQVVGGAALVTGFELARLVLTASLRAPLDLTSGLLGIAWGGAALTWVIGRPVQLALAWSWQAYRDSESKTRELRVHQGELHRVLRQLDDACYRLEQANEELARARQAADTARRLKAEFAATISHELRTPLNLIIGLSEMLVLNARTELATPDHELRDDLATIYRNAGQIANLVDDVLDLSQIDAHRMALEKQPTQLSHLADEVVAMVESLFRRKGIELLVDVPRELPALVVDPNRIRQILINLLNNAARFTNDGGVTIHARRQGSEVIVSVSDTGIGIAAADLKYVFDEFRQVGGGLGRRYGGSGFGLYISKRFAELHGGAMWVKSEEGVGTTFSFSLPVSTAVVGEAAPIGLDRLTRRTLAAPLTVGVAGSPRAVRLFQRYLDGFEVVEYPVPSGAQRSPANPAPQALVVADPRRLDADWKLPRVSCPLYEPEPIQAGAGPVVEQLAKPITRDQLAAALRRLGPHVSELLIVDDDPDLARLIAQMARGAGPYRVTIAYDGEEALRVLETGPCDAILLDVLMPGLDGRGVLRAMNRDERLRRVPVIVITSPHQGEEGIVAGPVSVGRAGGLTVGEAMGLVRAGLNALFPSLDEPESPTVAADTDRAPRGALVG